MASPPRSRSIRCLAFSALALATLVCSAAADDEGARRVERGSAPSNLTQSGSSSEEGETHRLLLQLLDESEDQRREAAQALTKLGSAALPYLIPAYKTSTPPLSLWLTWVLRDSGGPQSVGALLRKLEASTGELAVAILRSLAHFDDPGVVPSALRLMNSPDASVRRAAFAIFESRYDSTATPALFRGLEDSDSWVRASAERGLRLAIERGESLFVQLSARLVRSTDAAEALIHLLVATGDPRAIDSIAAARSRGGAERRRAIVRGLAILRSARAAEALCEFLDDEDAIVRGESVEGIARLGARASIPAIADRLTDPDENVRVAAHMALTRLAGCDVGTDREAWMRWWNTQSR